MTARAVREPQAALTPQRGAESVGKTVTGNKPPRSQIGCAMSSVAIRVPLQPQLRRGTIQGTTSWGGPGRREKLRAILMLLNRSRGFGQLTFLPFQQTRTGRRQHHCGQHNRPDARCAPHGASNLPDRDQSAWKESHVSPDVMTESRSSIDRVSQVNVHLSRRNATTA